MPLVLERERECEEVGRKKEEERRVSKEKDFVW